MIVRFEDIKDTFQLVANFCIAMGIAVGGFEYFQEEQQERKRQSMKYVHQFNTGDFLESRQNLLEPWFAYNLSVLTESGSVPQSVVDDLVLEVVAASIANSQIGDLRLDIVAVASFATAVQVCIESKICNDEIIYEQIGGYLSDFHCLYRPAIREVEGEFRIADLGKSVADITVAMGGCDG